MQEVTIDRLGSRGEGEARNATGTVHVPFALPGERVRGRVEAGRMDAHERLSASPDRAAPPCAHFGTCGGCALQHASDALVERWKAGLVREALARRGLAAEIARVVTSPPASRRRVAWSARGIGPEARVGFHRRGSDAVIAVPDCRVVRPELARLRDRLLPLARLAMPRRGELRLRATLTESGIDLDLGGAEPMAAAARAAAAREAETLDLARLTLAGEPLALRRPPRLRLGPAVVVPPPGGFLQATAEGEAALVAAVHAIAGSARRVIDLFAGCGTFALPLARTAEVHAAEGDAAALAALEAGWRQAAGMRRLTAERRDLFRRPLLPQELDGADAVVLDPPRQGARAQAEMLARSAVPVIAFISCDPGTFARDARILADGGYRMGPVTVVDQFRWSAHVELVAGFRRA
jgi:23S rRNA (uracil1939-C5)-methyltransferase